MELKICACILFYLFVSGGAWPRYGRPHPLYSGRQQTNENIFGSAILLGLDFNEIQSLQAAGGQGFGLGNIGLPNNGFPMNAYERKRARQDVNTLTALGVIDGPEEAGPLGALVSRNAPDPPDNPGGKDGGGKGKTKSKAKGTGKKKTKDKGQTKARTAKGQSRSNTISNAPSKTKVQKAKTTKLDNKGTRQGEGVAIQNFKVSKTKTATKFKTVEKRRKHPKKKLANKRRKDRPRNRGGENEGGDNGPSEGGGANMAKRRRNRKGNPGRGADPGEGRLAEQGWSGERQFGGRRRGRVLWRSGGDDAPIG